MTASHARELASICVAVVFIAAAFWVADDSAPPTLVLAAALAFCGWLALEVNG